jgi:hypothetical protein
MLLRAKWFLKRGVNNMFERFKQVWHETSSDWVFIEEETGSGHKVWFQKARIETHEDSGKKRVRFGSTIGPKFYEDASWQLATALTDRQDTYSTILMRGKFKPTFPKKEYKNEMETYR